MGKVRKWSDDQIEEMQRLMATGLSAAQVGQCLGVSKNTVLGCLWRSRERAAGRPTGNRTRKAQGIPVKERRAMFAEAPHG